MKQSFDKIDSLIAGLASGSVTEQVNAAKKLGELKDQQAVKRLIPLLESSRTSVLNLVSEAILKICQKVGKPAIKYVVEGLSTQYWEALDKAKEILQELGEAAVKSLIDALGDDRTHVRVRAREVLESIKKPAVKPLIEALKNRNKDVREQAAKALGAINDPLAIEPLIKTIKDKNEDVRFWVKASLQDITENYDLEDNGWEKWWKENKDRFIKDS